MRVPGANWVWEGDSGSWRGTGDILGAKSSAGPIPHETQMDAAVPSRLCLGSAVGGSFALPRDIFPKTGSRAHRCPPTGQSGDQVESRISPLRTKAFC